MFSPCCWGFESTRPKAVEGNDRHILTLCTLRASSEEAGAEPTTIRSSTRHYTYSRTHHHYYKGRYHYYRGNSPLLQDNLLEIITGIITGKSFIFSRPGPSLFKLVKRPILYIGILHMFSCFIHVLRNIRILGWELKFPSILNWEGGVFACIKRVGRGQE